MNAIEALMNIEDQVYEDFNVNCRQYGDTYIKMVLTMALKAIESVPVEDMTSEVSEILTASNFHQINHAIDIIKHLDKYSGREYIRRF